MAPDDRDERGESRRSRASSDDAPPSDGRAARAHRTRQAVAEALLALIQEGRLRPTSKEIAERAGVSERTIFQHFEDLETLFRVTSERLLERVVRSLGVVPHDGPLGDRVARFAEEIAYLNESMTPVRRASRLYEPFSPAVAEAIDGWRINLRRHLGRVFARELSAWSDEATRADVVESLALFASWSSWDNLRQHSGCSPERAQGIMARGLEALLESGGASDQDAALAPDE